MKTKAPTLLDRFLEDKEITPANLHKWSYDSWIELKVWVARNPLTDAIDLASMASDMKVSVRESLWKNPSLPVEALEALAFGPWSDVKIKRRVINHENINSELLRLLSNEENESILCEVAKNHKTPADVLHTLAKSSYSEVRGYVASNSSTTLETLMFLASAPEHASVQINVAENPNVSPEALHLLALEAFDPNVLKVLLSDPRLFEEDQVMILLRLC